jgi:hypothetical protein
MKRISVDGDSDRASLRARWRRLSATQRLTVRGLVVLGAIALLGIATGGWSQRAIASDQSVPPPGADGVWSQWRFLRQSLDSVTGDLELTRLELERAKAIMGFSARYRVPADLATLIHDVAVSEGLDPELGFRLVRVESAFNPLARSSVGAVGLVQVRLATARFYEPEITEEALREPATNLRIGFRYLRDLIESYGDLRIALLAYNRGPQRVSDLLGDGQDPGNGFASSVMKDYPGF